MREKAELNEMHKVRETLPFSVSDSVQNTYWPLSHCAKTLPAFSKDTSSFEVSAFGNKSLVNTYIKS